MKCIEDEFEVLGDFNTAATKNLMIVYELCDSSKRTCKSEAEIGRMLAYSYILIIENEERFQHHKEPDSGEMIVRGTKSSWYALS